MFLLGQDGFGKFYLEVWRKSTGSVVFSSQVFRPCLLIQVLDFLPELLLLGSDLELSEFVLCQFRLVSAFKVRQRQRFLKCLEGVPLACQVHHS